MGLGRWIADKAERALLGDREVSQGGMDEALRDMAAGKPREDDGDEKRRKK